MTSDTGVLCEIRAGKCRFEGDMVHPCLKKGTLRLYQVREKSHMNTTSQGVDELLCLQWHARDEKEMEVRVNRATHNAIRTAITFLEMHT